MQALAEINIMNMSAGASWGSGGGGGTCVIFSTQTLEN